MACWLLRTGRASECFQLTGSYAARMEMQRRQARLGILAAHLRRKSRLDL
jgi:hypothetical protein